MNLNRRLTRRDALMGIASLAGAAAAALLTGGRAARPETLVAQPLKPVDFQPIELSPRDLEYQAWMNEWARINHSAGKTGYSALLAPIHESDHCLVFDEASLFREEDYINALQTLDIDRSKGYSVRWNPDYRGPQHLLEWQAEMGKPIFASDFSVGISGR